MKKQTIAIIIILIIMGLAFNVKNVKAENYEIPEKYNEYFENYNLMSWRYSNDTEYYDNYKDYKNSVNKILKNEYNNPQIEEILNTYENYIFVYENTGFAKVYFWNDNDIEIFLNASKGKLTVSGNPLVNRLGLYFKNNNLNNHGTITFSPKDDKILKTYLTGNTY